MIETRPGTVLALACLFFFFFSATFGGLPADCAFPLASRCGFSQKIVGILNGLPGVEYTTFDILNDEGVRQSKFLTMRVSHLLLSFSHADSTRPPVALARSRSLTHTEMKQISDWPTFPQLIVNGEFVGGLDIVKEMQESGELADVIRGS